jgi:hypothetical protein
MADNSPDRIERAIKRIEAAATARAFATEKLTRRHAVLRERIGAAIDSLDGLIARENAEVD